MNAIQQYHRTVENVINSLNGNKFSSHDFINALIRWHREIYDDLMHYYNDNPTTCNQNIGKYLLLNADELNIIPEGKEKSFNVNGNQNLNQIWVKNI